jgi:hypothetical protein
LLYFSWQPKVTYLKIGQFSDQPWINLWTALSSKVI